MTYVQSGYKWGGGDWGDASGQVYWTMDSLAGLNFDTSLYNMSDFQGALQDAFDAWEDVAAIDFTYTSNAALADFDVTTAYLAGSTIGEAWMSHTGGPSPSQLISAEVRFDTEEGWAPYGETDLSFYAVALHEIGHAIGLGHTSGDNAQIMYPSITSLNELGDGDKAGAQSIYGLDDSDEPAPDPDSGDPDTGDGGASGAADAGGVFGIIFLLLGLIALITGSVGAVVGAFSKEEEPEEDGDKDGETDGHDHVAGADHEDGPLLSDFVTFTGLVDDDDLEYSLHRLTLDGCEEDQGCHCGDCHDCMADHEENDLFALI